MPSPSSSRVSRSPAWAVTARRSTMVESRLTTASRVAIMVLSSLPSPRVALSSAVSSARPRVTRRRSSRFSLSMPSVSSRVRSAAASGPWICPSARSCDRNRRTSSPRAVSSSSVRCTLSPSSSMEAALRPWNTWPGSTGSPSPGSISTSISPTRPFITRTILASSCRVSHSSISMVTRTLPGMISKPWTWPTRMPRAWTRSPWRRPSTAGKSTWYLTMSVSRLTRLKNMMPAMRTPMATSTISPTWMSRVR